MAGRETEHEGHFFSPFLLPRQEQKAYFPEGRLDWSQTAPLYRHRVGCNLLLKARSPPEVDLQQTCVKMHLKGYNALH